MTHMTLHDGREIDLWKPDFSGVQLETFGMMLYRQLRYNGATKRPYCVLEHTIRGARTCLEPKYSVGLGAYGRDTAKYFLAHDMHEIVTGDITSPIAAHIGSVHLVRLKERLDAAIRDRFGMAEPGDHIRECVAAVDQCMFQREWNDLMPTAFDRAAPGGCHDGPVRNFIGDHQIMPQMIPEYDRPGPHQLIAEFCHLWRLVRQ